MPFSAVLMAYVMPAMCLGAAIYGYFVGKPGWAWWFLGVVLLLPHIKIGE